MTQLLLERLKVEMARAPYHAFLDPDPVSVNEAAGEVKVLFRAKPEFRRAYDSEDWHGGVLAAMCDIAAHAAVAVRLGDMAPTIDLRVDFLAPARGDLVATGKLLRLGRSIGRADVEITDPNGKLVAVGRAVFSALNAQAK
ncbi:MAG: PaaI family thioesterase [Beijerinckiaceae bacterium]